MPTKISDLNAVSSLVGDEVFPVVQSGSTKKASVSDINNLVYVKGYCAGDGSDENTNFRRALTAANGKTLLLEHGKTYGVTQKIQLNSICPAGITIEFNGSSIKAVGTWTDAVVLTATNLLTDTAYTGAVLRNGIIDANSQANLTPLFGHWSRAVVDNLEVKGGTVYQANPVFEDSTIFHPIVTGNAAQSNNGWDCKLVRCTVYHPVVDMADNETESGWWLNDAEDTEIYGLKADNIGFTAIGGEKCRRVTYYSPKCLADTADTNEKIITHIASAYPGAVVSGDGATTATVTHASVDHGRTVGEYVVVESATTAAFNGAWKIATTPTSKTFTYTTTGTAVAGNDATAVVTFPCENITLVDPHVRGSASAVAIGISFSDDISPSVIGGEVSNVAVGVNFAGGVYSGNVLRVIGTKLDNNVTLPVQAAAVLSDQLVVRGCEGFADWSSIKTISNNSATPDVSASNFYEIGNGSATTITNFVAGDTNRFRSGRLLWVLFTTGNTTLSHGTAANQIRLRGGINFTPIANTAMAFQRGSAGNWIEAYRTTTTSAYDQMQRLVVNTTAVGNVGGGTDTLVTYSMPANTLFANGKGVRITAWGTTANNNNPKTVAMLFGSATIATQALTVSEAGKWRITAEVIRTSSGNQTWTSQLLAGPTLINKPDSGTATETDSSAISIKCAGTVTDGGGGINNDDIVETGHVIELIN